MWIFSVDFVEIGTKLNTWNAHACENGRFIELLDKEMYFTPYHASQCCEKRNIKFNAFKKCFK